MKVSRTEVRWKEWLGFYIHSAHSTADNSPARASVTKVEDLMVNIEAENDETGRRVFSEQQPTCCFM